MDLAEDTSEDEEELGYKLDLLRTSQGEEEVQEYMSTEGAIMV